MNAKLIDTRRLTCTWYTADTHTDTIAAIGQTLVDDLLRLCLMVGVDTLYQRHGLREDGDIAFQNSIYHLCGREFTTTVTLQIRVDDGRLLDATIDLQACIFGTVLGMLHTIHFSLFTLILMINLA